MAAPTTTPALDEGTTDRLSAAFHRCFSELEAEEGVFADDALFDLLPPMWRFQIRGDGARFVEQLRSIAQGPVEVAVLRTLPTSTGFVTEHIETQHTPKGTVAARRVHVCEVDGGLIRRVTTYCNGGWDEEHRARHAAEAPMVEA